MTIRPEAIASSMTLQGQSLRHTNPMNRQAFWK
nr:MAG TPA: hypothetical protein [Caudoviricetes sp.]